MKNIFVIILSLISLNLLAQKQYTQTIRGKVVDAETKQAIVGANVYVLNSEPLIGASTDSQGNFILKDLKIGVYDIKISFITYNSLVLNNMYLTSAKELVLNVNLYEKIIESDIVEITANRNQEQINEMATVSVISISNIENSHIAGGLFDPQRAILSFAGVKNQGDINNGISIRGNKPTNMLWQLEGIEIQDPNHFTLSGTFGGNYINGAISSISSNLLKNINIYSGAFPAEYGNAISGVMDLTLREGNDKNFEYNVNFGMLGLEASAEGPLEMGGSFLVSYRYSTMDIASNLGFDFNNSKIGYRDINYKVSIPTKKIGKFTFFGIAAWSSSEDIKSFNSKNKWWKTSYDNDVFGFSHQINLTKKSYLKNTFAYNRINTNYYDFKTIKDFSNSYQKIFYYRKENIFRYNLVLHNKLNYKNILLSGFKASLPKIKLSKGIEIINNPFPLYISNTNTKFDNSTFYIQAFLQWKHKFSNTFSINSGVHFLLFTYNWKNSLEPRFSLKWNAHKNHTLNFGMGLHSKIEFLPIYMATVYKQSKDPFTSYLKKSNFNKDLKLSKSFHISANYIAKPLKKISFKIEPYLQYHFHIPQYSKLFYIYDQYPNTSKIIDSVYNTFSTLNTSYDYYSQELDNKGTGLNYGIELTLKKQFAKNYYFLISSSIFRSFYKTPAYKTWQPTNYDGLFTFAVSTGKDFKLGKLKQSILSFNGRFLWSGGYIKNNFFYSEITTKKTFERYKNYYKLDTKIAYILNKKKFTYTLALDLLNTTNHKNETLDYYSQGSGILPVLSFNFRFQK